MRHLLVIATAAIMLMGTHCENNGWSWNGNKPEDSIPSGSEVSETSIDPEDADKIIDEILTSTRAGKSIDGFDQVYDPSFKDAIEKGNDVEARNLIKDRLCYLGLMQCEESVEGKRPYIRPDELIYAQPVSIRPIGRPIPSLPVKQGYGPPKPVPFPPKYGPPINKPPRRGYGPPFPSKPFFTKPILNQQEFAGSSYIEPIEQDTPYQFEIQKEKKVEVVVTPPAGPQQHVHHHYHHNTEGGKPAIVSSAAAAVSSFGQATYNPVTTPGLGSIGGTNFGGSYGGQTIAHYGQQKPVYESFSPSSFGTSVGSYGSSGLYKKELVLGGGSSINSNYLQANYADKYQGLETARGENYDCVCVPYDQCPNHEVIGRKDDLYLPLDPRNLKTDIEAEEERVITDGNGTMTVVRVPKAANATVEVTTQKTITKREAPQEKPEEKSNIEARQYGSYTNTNNNGYGNKKVQPTFGISFGLPNQGAHGYPVNPYSPNPFVNPYGGAIGQQGINLGLVSVNPLVSLQVTKDDHGDKVLKPFVNLHVTPNDYLVHKVGDLFHYKKHLVYNKHKHLHFHKPNHYYHSGPGYHHPPSYHPHDLYSHPHVEPYHDPHSHYPGHEYGPPEHYPGPEYAPHHEEYPSGHHEYPAPSSYFDNPYNYGGPPSHYLGRTSDNSTDSVEGTNLLLQYQDQYRETPDSYGNSRKGKSFSKAASNPVKFPSSRKRRDVTASKRQGYFGRPATCGPRHVCCKRPIRPDVPAVGQKQCGLRHSQGINGRIKNPVYVDGDSEFGEYPWQVAILKKDPKESVYVCGGTLIDSLHIITAAHCVKTYKGFDLRVRLGEWDVNHDVEFYPYIERDIISVHVHPEFYAGTLYNDLAILRMDKPVDWVKQPHISPACLPSPHEDYSNTRCWTTGWGKDAFGDFGKYQNILKEVDVPIVPHGVCQRQLQQTRLGYEFKLHPGFVCAGGEEGKDACKGDGGGPMVCETGGSWKVVGVVSWGIGCGQVGVPGVYVKVAHYLDWIRQITQRY